MPSPGLRRDDRMLPRCWRTTACPSKLCRPGRRTRVSSSPCHTRSSIRCSTESMRSWWGRMHTCSKGYRRSRWGMGNNAKCSKRRNRNSSSNGSGMHGMVCSGTWRSDPNHSNRSNDPSSDYLCQQEPSSNRLHHNLRVRSTPCPFQPRAAQPRRAHASALLRYTFHWTPYSCE